MQNKRRIIEETNGEQAKNECRTQKTSARRGEGGHGKIEEKHRMNKEKRKKK